jgi:hypothetical protein
MLCLGLQSTSRVPPDDTVPMRWRGTTKYLGLGADIQAPSVSRCNTKCYKRKAGHLWEGEGKKVYLTNIWVHPPYPGLPSYPLPSHFLAICPCMSMYVKSLPPKIEYSKFKFKFQWFSHSLNKYLPETQVSHLREFLLERVIFIRNPISWTIEELVATSSMDEIYQK